MAHQQQCNQVEILYNEKRLFRYVWEKVPAHLRAIHFDFEGSLWTASDIDNLENLLCKYSHRFSAHT